MTNSIRTLLKPFLIISYVFGLRIVNLSNPLKLWFSFLYMLLIWSLYYFLSISAFISFFSKFYPIENNICHWLELFATLLSILFGVYHDKKFQNCLKKFEIVDNTLFKLGTRTNYDKLYKKTALLILGWFMIVVLMMYGTARVIKNEHDLNVATSMFYVFTREHPCSINFFGDMITASIIAYVGLKFDQVNEHLQNMIKNNKRKIIQIWESSTLHPHQYKFPKTLSNKYIIWIVIHLHLELRKISHDIDLIYGTQMTFKMAYYFGWIVLDLRTTLYAILTKNYVKSRIITATVYSFWILYNVFKCLLINYTCETVYTKARTTADLLNKLSYFTSDNEIREIISHVSLRIVYAPLRFCGIGFFQFGFKFLYRFVMSIATVLVIIIQAELNKYISIKL